MFVVRIVSTKKICRDIYFGVSKSYIGFSVNGCSWTQWEISVISAVGRDVHYVACREGSVSFELLEVCVSSRVVTSAGDDLVF